MRTALILALLVVAGCSRIGKTATEEVGAARLTSATVDPRDDAATEPDHSITRRVEATIAADAELSQAARNVEVTVTSGIVTLTGTVDDAETKKALELLANNVRGVVDTLDKVQIAPSLNTPQAADETIAYSLQRSLAFDPTIAHDAERVSIDVLRGRVVLRGATSALDTREAAARIAEQTPGVVAVKNELSVRPR
ncbi:MAG: BON domain-containing protein [Labilithrix sp.]|nr:BON domain-containing protein [Labilithrix sp.]